MHSCEHLDMNTVQRCNKPATIAYERLNEAHFDGRRWYYCDPHGEHAKGDKRFKWHMLEPALTEADFWKELNS